MAQPTPVFFVGGTGHVGAAVLQQLLTQHPDVAVTVLARSEDKAARLREKFPQVKTIIGSTLDYDKVEDAAKNADLVINTSPDITHEEGIKAILKGLKARGAIIGKKPYYVHTAGASLIWDEPTGSKDARWWDDMKDSQELASLDEAYTHSSTDRIVRNAADDVNVAIVSPGFVAGMSPSPDHPTPITTHGILLTARAFKSGYQIAQGENTHAWIHVQDLARLFMILINAALGQPPANPPFPLWGREAYYFATGEDVSFRKFMEALAPVMKKQGIITSEEIKSVSVKEAARASLAGPNYDPDAPPPPIDSWAMHIAIMYGINMRITGARAAALGWKPEHGSVTETFEEIISEHLKLEERQKAQQA